MTDGANLSRVHHGVREFLARRLGDRKTLGRWRLNDEEQDRILRELSSDLKKLVHDHGVDAHANWSIPQVYLRD